jgi:ATP-dependent protease ClpP protease subunit
MHVGGVAHSAATLLLQFADIRSMEPYSTMRIHPITGDYDAQTLSISDLQGELDGFKYTHFIYYDILSRRSGKDVEALFKRDHLAQDILLYPEDCIEWNLIDEILDYCIPDPAKPILTSIESASSVLTFPQRDSTSSTASNGKTSRRRRRKAS